MIQRISHKNALLTVVMVAAASLVTGGMMMTSVHAENAREIYDNTVLAAEMEFAETIQQAKTDLEKITSDTNADVNAKEQAQERYDKKVEQAKTLRDQKIEQARTEYRQTTTEQPISLDASKGQLVKTILDAKTEYEIQLDQAEQNYKETRAKIIDNKELEQLEEDFEQIIDEIKQVYNETIAAANEEYQKIKSSISGDDRDA